MNPVLPDRREAGRRLARQLAERVGPGTGTVVLALPRGGVPVACEIARALGAPLDLLFVRKIGLPEQPELAYAAVVDGAHPETVVNEEVARWAAVEPGFLAAATRRELAEIERRRRAYLGDAPPLPLAGRCVILVDDGLATGTSARAALRALRRQAPARLVLAVPVAPADTLRALAGLVDEAVCLAMPEPFCAISLHYADFHQLDDAEVVAELASLQAIDST